MVLFIMDYLGFIFNIVNGSFSLLGFVKRVLVEKTLISENQKLNKLHRMALNVLFWWIGGNIVLSAIMLFFSTGKMFYFFEMNIIWNIITALFGIYAYSKVSGESTEEISTWGFVEKIYGVQKILAFKIGLCVAYIVIGGFLIDKGISIASNMLLGFGSSILLQGLMLFAFETVVFLLHQYSVQKVIATLKESAE